MAGDTAKAKAAYQDFFTLWRGADPEIPIFKRAKVEYSKLGSSTGGMQHSPGPRTEGCAER